MTTSYAVGHQLPSLTSTTSGPSTLVDVFAATVAAHGHRVALEADDGRRTYGELYRDVHDLAGALRRRGVGVGDRVGVQVPSGTLGLYTSILAVLHVGAAYVPVDADDPQTRAEVIWADADVCAVIGAGGTIGERHRGGDTVGFARAEGHAWVIFTSGSTGRPKGVAVTHANAVAFVQAEAQLLHLTPGDRVAAGLSVGFDASCEEMWLAWRNGAALVAAPRETVRSGAAFGHWLAAHGITVVSTVPTLAGMWDAADLDAVRLLIVGGEACPEELGWRLAADREVWNTYGPTEATVVSTAGRIMPGRPVTIGAPLAGWQVAVVGPDATPVPDGQAGELVIAGSGLGSYLDHDLDVARYAPLPALGWHRAYRTGDIVRNTDQGLVFVGRSDDQVKVGGRRIELGEVTAALQSVPGVRAGTGAVQRTGAGDPVLVGYVVSDLSAGTIRDALREALPDGLVPIIAHLEQLPMSGSGKVDRAALPWPPASAGDTLDAGPTQTWLAELWQRHLGVRPSDPADDFFVLGGSSLAAAKLTSELRERYPAAAVADIYQHRTLAQLAARLDEQAAADRSTAAGPRTRHLRVAQLAALSVTLLFQLPGWVLGIGLFDDLTGSGVRIGWLWLAATYVLLISPWGRLAVAALARRTLLHGVAPGRYSRHSALAARVWLTDRIGDAMQVAAFGGTPFAARVARLLGMDVAPDAALGSLPSLASWVRVGRGATVEGDADVQGWTVEADELVIGEVVVGDYARVGARALLSPGVVVGDYAEVEPAALVATSVPAGQRWAGSPAVAVGTAGSWPQAAPARASHRLRAAYAVSLTLLSWLPAAIGLAVFAALALLAGGWSQLITDAVDVGPLWLALPALAALFVTVDALTLALAARWAARWITPGWHRAGRVTWAYWLHNTLMAMSRTQLFPMYCSSVTRSWLRLAGVRIGRGTEVSTAVGLGPLVTLGEGSFLADDVVFNVVRAHRGWVHLRAIAVGDGVFLGNGAMVEGGTTLGNGSLVGVQTVPPADVPAGTSWFGVPALEFPRTADAVDPSRTTVPPARLKVARALCDTVRILLPTTVSLLLGFVMFGALDRIATDVHDGWWPLLVLAPLFTAAAGLAAVLVTVVVKWTLMGRYRAGEHPFWSWFVWRDEIVNSCQESLAGPWLLDEALGTPLMTPYLRVMGTRVGRDTWVDTLTISEFDMVRLDDGATANRRSCIESHLFHDRLMRIGPVHLGADVTLGASTAVLPDTVLEDGVTVDGRSVVLRGERLPAGSRWHGAPVVAR